MVAFNYNNTVKSHLVRVLLFHIQRDIPLNLNVCGVNFTLGSYMILLWPTCSWGSEKSCWQYIISSLSSLMNLGIIHVYTNFMIQLFKKRLNILCFALRVHFKIVNYIFSFQNCINWFFIGQLQCTFIKGCHMLKFNAFWVLFFYEINIYCSNTSSFKSPLMLFQYF